MTQQTNPAKNATDSPIVEPRGSIVLTGWINEEHCSMRCVAETDPSVLANRVAFIEKTPRVRVAPFNKDCEYDWKNWKEGPKGTAPEYGRYQPSRDWCDQQLLEMGYILGETEPEDQDHKETASRPSRPCN
jgi:hypothetical protein